MNMKRLFTSIIISLATMPMLAQGWPANYEGVMLQGFYWDSYTDTKWTNLESQADEMSQFFNLIWVPQSGYCNSLSNQMGYSDIWWLDHRSCFGTEAELRKMINTFKSKGTGIIEDVVINHKNGNTSWCDFPNESKNGYTLTWDNDNFSGICYTDECNTASNLSQWAKGAFNGKKATGAKDTGTNFDGARDLDHTNAQVQQNIKTYLKFLLNDLGYAGFRYDMVAGYSPEYTGIYNTTVNPQFSVGEYWMEGGKTAIVNWINGTKVNNVIQSAAFDFSMKWNINDVFSTATNWSKLNNAALATDANYARYAVTFVDNHDTGRPNNNPLYANIEAANAFILTLPGTPCVWLKHWQTYKVAIKKLILTRKLAGVHNQSAILKQDASANGYVLNVQGTKGNLLLLLGTATTSTTGYKLAVEGGNYKLYISDTVDISALDDIKEDAFTAPDCCKINEGEVCAFYEAPTTWSVVKCWAWDNQNNYTGGSWPGQNCTKVGTNNGKNVWKWTYNGTLSTLPSNIIFNNGSGTQTSDLVFANGGYYNEAGALQGVVTGIQLTTIKAIDNKLQRVYTIDGHLLRVLPAGTSINDALNQLGHGVYIINGKKVTK